MALPTDNRKLTTGAQEINQQYKEREIQARAKELKLPYVNLATLPVNPDLADVIGKEEAEAAQAALYAQVGKKLRVAVSDPSNEKTKALLERLQKDGYQVDLSISSDESIRFGHRIYYTDTYQKQADLKNVVVETDLGSYLQEVESLKTLRDKVESESVDRGLNYIHVGAYKAKASDIHFEPEMDRVDVRFRIDGVLQLVFSLTPKTYQGLMTQIKHLSHLKLNITNKPQDGQHSFWINQRQINVRVSTLPTHYGESTVMRLLDTARMKIPLEQLGFEGEALERIKEAATLTHGMILVTGPTGSGKTTTLYSMLQQIDTKTRKIITLEDPIEYNLDGVSQSQVDEEGGFDFANGLRSILRQDPDVIMVGEIRDTKTAETAMQASLTGHIVFSTLHTNSAVESIPRLLNMGVRSFILAPALNLIVAQRLVRKLCDHCAAPSPITEAERKQIEAVATQLKNRGIDAPAIPAELRRAKGCPQCSDTGFRGQMVVAEVLPFDSTLRDLILGEAPITKLHEHIEHTLKMVTIYEDGVLKALRGLTTLQEVERVAK